MRILEWLRPAPKKKSRPLELHELAANVLAWSGCEELPFNACECWRQSLDDTILVRLFDCRMSLEGHGNEWARAWDESLPGTMQSRKFACSPAVLEESTEFIRTVFLPRYREALTPEAQSQT